MNINIATILNSQKTTAFYFSGVDFNFHIDKNDGEQRFNSKSYHDVFCWLGFDSLSSSIFKTENFKKRYRVILKKAGNVFFGTINDEPIFYFKKGDSWAWTNDIYYIESNINVDIVREAKAALGVSFIDNCNSFIKASDLSIIKNESKYHALS